MSNFHFEILPRSQKELWSKLDQIPNDFILYGGTAIALRLGHRKSVDFDFFSNKQFNNDQLYNSIDFLKGGQVIQSERNTLTVLALSNHGNVKVSFFGNLGLSQIEYPEIMDNRIKMASMIDLFGMKCATVPQRVEAKDYIDIDTILSNTNLKLVDGMGAAQSIYGKRYNSVFTLKALSFFENEELQNLTKDLKIRLINSVKESTLLSVTAFQNTNEIGEMVNSQTKEHGK